MTMMKPLLVDRPLMRGSKRTVTVNLAESPLGWLRARRLIDEASVDSGRIVVQVVTGTGRRHLAWNWLASVLRLRARHATTREIIGREMRIDADPPQALSIDGEVLARTPFVARVAKAVILVAAPA